MKSSHISLFDDGRVRIDPNAKTLAYFCRTLPVKIDGTLLDEDVPLLDQRTERFFKS